MSGSRSVESLLSSSAVQPPPEPIYELTTAGSREDFIYGGGTGGDLLQQQQLGPPPAFERGEYQRMSAVDAGTMMRRLQTAQQKQQHQQANGKQGMMLNRVRGNYSTRLACVQSEYLFSFFRIGFTNQLTTSPRWQLALPFYQAERPRLTWAVAAASKVECGPMWCHSI